MVLTQSEELAALVALCRARSEAANPEVPHHRRAPVVVAIDGPAGAGKTTLSQHLAPLLTWEDGDGYQRDAPVVHLDDLYAGWADGPSGGANRLAKNVLAPLAAGRPGRYRRYEWATDQFAEPHEVARAPYLIVEGSGSGAGAAQVPAMDSVLVWLDADDKDRVARVLARDGEHLRAELEDWMKAERQHFAADRTRDRADVVLRRDTNLGRWVPGEN